MGVEAEASVGAAVGFVGEGKGHVGEGEGHVGETEGRVGEGEGLWPESRPTGSAGYNPNCSRKSIACVLLK